MSFSIRCLQKLLYEIQKWPGVGPRSAQKLILHLLKKRGEDIPALVNALQDIMSHIQLCKECFGWAENSKICAICENSSRDHQVLCVVENPFDVFRIEDSNTFQGDYHVLHGLISPLNNIHPESLTIDSLIKKINEKKVKEIILTLDTSLEGDTTALYLVNQLKHLDTKVSKLALGIPMGSPLDFVDDQTLWQAMENRIEI